MGNPAGVKRDFEGLERRRMAAAKLLQQGVSQAEVARRLGVHRQSVIRWVRELRKSGRARPVSARARRTQGQAERGRLAGNRAGAQTRTASTGLRDGTVDGATGRPADRATVRGALPSCARLAPAGTVGLELPAPGRSRAGA